MKTANLHGVWGEKLAAKFLRKNGYRILDTNYSCRFGEIDIIAENDSFLVFVEVKLRKNDTYGTAREFVTAQKQERLRKTALMYLQQSELEKQPRFDVIEIYAPDGIKTPRPLITHLEDVF